MSLYRKYRPQNFANLVGQDHVRKTVLNEIKTGRVGHAFLFTGPRGTGKTSTARLIAKAINCTARTEEGEPCDECEFCRTIAEGSLIDVIEIDAASNRGIDEIRDLREKIKFAPTRAKNKIYIIDEVHMLTKEAFNALLKTLEEPPPNVFFILATTEVHKVPETIISRCQRFDFKRINVRTLMTRLQFIAQKEAFEVEDKAIELIARHVSGGLRDAISLLEQMVFENKLSYEHVRAHLGVTGHKTIEDFYEYLRTCDHKNALHLINQIHNEGYDLDSFLRESLDYARECLLQEIEENRHDGVQSVILIIDALLEAKEGLRQSPIPQLLIEIAIVKICLPGGVREAGAPANKQKLQPKSREDSALADLMKNSDQAKNIAAANAGEQRTADTIQKEFAVQDAPSDNIEMEVADVDKEWPRVLEQIQPPSLRRSLREGKITSCDEHEITVSFTDKWHFEKIKNIENTAKIEQAMQKIFGKSIKLVCALQKKITLASNTDSQNEETEAPRERTKVKPPAEEDTATKALEIFGGEEM